MRRTSALLPTALIFVFHACGDDAASNPATLNSCDSLSDAGITLLQHTPAIIDSLSAEELATLGSTEDTPAAFTEIETRGDALTARADAIGCTDAEMTSLMTARVDRLSSDTVFGEFLIESVRTGDGGFFE